MNNYHAIKIQQAQIYDTNEGSIMMTELWIQLSCNQIILSVANTTDMNTTEELICQGCIGCLDISNNMFS